MLSKTLKSEQRTGIGGFASRYARGTSAHREKEWLATSAGSMKLDTVPPMTPPYYFPPNVLQYRWWSTCRLPERNTQFRLQQATRYLI